MKTLIELLVAKLTNNTDNKKTISAKRAGYAHLENVGTFGHVL